MLEPGGSPPPLNMPGGSSPPLNAALGTCTNRRYSRSYYRRPDVVAALWAFGLLTFYYAATILTYYLLQSLQGYAAWDSSVVSGRAAQGLAIYMIIVLAPACVYALIVRGLYMFHYRHVAQIDTYTVATSTPLLLSPSKMLFLAGQFFSRNVRSSDTGKVYLIRIYLTLGITFACLVIASLHTVYSFIIPFMFRMARTAELEPLPDSPLSRASSPLPLAALASAPPKASLPPRASRTRRLSPRSRPRSAIN